MNCVDVNCVDMNCVDMNCVDMNCVDVNCVDVNCVDVNCIDMNCVDVNCGDESYADKTFRDESFAVMKVLSKSSSKTPSRPQSRSLYVLVLHCMSLGMTPVGREAPLIEVIELVDGSSKLGRGRPQSCLPPLTPGTHPHHQRAFCWKLLQVPPFFAILKTLNSRVWR